MSLTPVTTTFWCKVAPLRNYSCGKFEPFAQFSLYTQLGEPNKRLFKPRFVSQNTPFLPLKAGAVHQAISKRVLVVYMQQTNNYVTTFPLTYLTCGYTDTGAHTLRFALHISTS